MLDADVSETAAAISRSKHTGYYYVIQMFGRPKSNAIQFQIANRSGVVIHYKVGEQNFDIEPNYIRSHTCCRPPALTVELNQQTVTRNPVNGEQFGMAERAGRIVLEKD